MLKGEAKTAYQRDYMRRKRAGLPTRKEPKPWQPSQRMINNIEHWARVRASSSPWRLSRVGRQIIDGLTLDNDESWMEACRRYKAHIDAQRDRRKQAKQAAAAPPEPRCCLFCRTPETAKRIFISNGWRLICERCVAKAATLIVRKRKTSGRKNARRSLRQLIKLR